MSEGQGRGPGRSAVIAGAALLLVAAVIALSLSRGEDAPRSPRSQPAPQAAPAPAEVPVDPEGGALRLEARKQLAIDRSALDAGSTLAFEAVVPEGVEATWARLVTPDSVGHEIEPGPATASGIRLDVPVEWLGTPGRYIFELRTNERTPLPLRRFAIEMR